MSAVIGFDCACSFCGYNMRGLALGGRCPECGEPVPEAIRWKRLVFQPAAFLRRLVIGATIGYAGSIGLLCWLITFVASFLRDAEHWDNGTDHYRVVTWLLYGLPPVALGLLHLSVAVITWRSPAMCYRKKGVEIAAKWSAVIGAATMAPIATLWVLFAEAEGESNPLFIAFFCSLAVWLLVSVLAYFEGITRIRTLASMTPGGSCRWLTKLLLWYPLVIFVPIGGVLLSPVWFVMLWLLFHRLRRAFRETEREGAAMRRLGEEAAARLQTETLYTAHWR